jgi:hypothetical protein
VMERARLLMLPDIHHRALGLSVLAGRVDDKAGWRGHEDLEIADAEAGP